MEKLDRPVNGNWFGDGEIVDADLMVDLLETYRFGKHNVPVGKIRSKAIATAPLPDNTTEIEGDNGSQGLVGNTLVHGNTDSVSSNSDPIILETTMSETEPSSNEETDCNLLESNSENERQQNAEDDEIEEEEEEENSERLSSDSEEKSNLEKLLATQERYELYCPNCCSCITRRVILKKTKSGKDFDLPVNPIANVPVLDESNEIEEIEPPVKVGYQEDKEKSVIITCLACLKRFIRFGARFLLLDYIRRKPVQEPEIPPENQPDGERLAVELLKSTVYGGLTETIISLGVVSSASAAGSSTENILALAVANLAGGLIILAQNLQDLRTNLDQEKDRYEELLGRRTNMRLHILVAVLSYIFFGLLPPLVYAFSETELKNYKLISTSIVCVVLLGMLKVYVRKPHESAKSYLKSAAYYTSIVVASSGVSYIVGDIMGKYIEKLGWFSSDQTSWFSSDKTGWFSSDKTGWFSSDQSCLFNM